MLEEVLRNCVTQICLRYSKHVIEAAEADLHDIALYFRNKVVILSGLIMNYVEDERFL